MEHTKSITTLQTATHKGAEGYLLTLGSLSVTLLKRGAKIQSIRWQDREWLWQSAGKRYRFSAYGDVFETGDFSGFDEMFPNISACPYPAQPFDGVALPDHGEVWTQDWTCEADGDALACAVSGVALPYRFSKRISLEQDAIQIAYQARNLSDHPLCYLWAAHPLFVLEDGMWVELAGCQRIFNACQDKDNLGEFGRMHNWPVAASGRDMRLLSGANQTYQKYYAWNELQENRAVLHYPDHTRITLEAPIAQVPYLGMWVDECGYGAHPMRCVTPEPCTAAPDRLDWAQTYDRQSMLPPHGEATWQLRISFRDEGHVVLPPV